MAARLFSRIRLAGWLGLGLALLACGCGASEEGSTNSIHRRLGDHQMVERAGFGPDWPLKVDRGTIACRRRPDGRLLLVSVPIGRTYALNGLAERHGYPAVETLGDGFGLGVLIGDTIKLCITG